MVSFLDYKIIVKHNNSLAPRDACFLFGAITLIAFAVSLGVARAGAWPVLPFAGLEILAFGCAFYYVYLHAGDFECITINENEVVVEKHQCKSSEVTTFQRYWVRAMIKTKPDGSQGIFIGSHGKDIEFGGRFVTDDQRVELLKKIKVAVSKQVS